MNLEDLQKVAVTCWAIWSDRNSHFHNKPIPPSLIRSNWIKKYIVDYLKANTDPSSSRCPVIRAPIKKWCPPPVGRLKINVDATWKLGFPDTGIGIICRNEVGDIVGASAIYDDLDYPSPMAELKAILEGLIFAERRGLRQILVEYDCLQATNLISMDVEVRSELGTLVDSIRSLALSFPDIKISYSQRNSNVVADAIAKWARTEKNSCVWTYAYPDWLCKLVFDDQVSSAHVAF